MEKKAFGTNKKAERALRRKLKKLSHPSDILET